MHGDGDAALGMFIQDGLWKPGAFRAKDKHISHSVFHVCIAFRALGAAIENPALWVKVMEFIEAFVHLELQLGPVVQARSLDLFIGEQEPAGLDDV